MPARGRWSLAWVAGALVATAGCLASPPGSFDDAQPGPSIGMPDARADALADGTVSGGKGDGAPDALALDANLESGTAPEAAAGDSSPPEEGVGDTSVPEAGDMDTTVPDVGVVDASVPDNTALDTSVPDGSVVDTGSPVDTGPDVVPCTSMELRCGGTCVPNDATNCGTCGHVCTTTVPNAQPACSGSACGHTCSGAYPNDCSTACVNFMTDSNNCGACGNVCAVGTCWNGHCPTAVGPFVSDAGTVTGLAIDSTNAYGGFSGGVVLKCPLSGCSGGASILASGQTQVFAISASSAGVFWLTVTANDTFAVGCSPATCSGGVLTYGTQAIANGQFQGLASDTNNVYFGLLAATGALDSCPAGGCGIPQTVSNSVLPYSIAAASGYVYWTDETNLNYSVRKCSTGGCAAGGQTLFTATAVGASYSDIVADGANVYWVDTGLNNVLECPATGCPASGPLTLATGGNPIAVDSANVYWFTSSALVRCAISGCNQTPTTMISGLSSPGPAIAVDATNVYWFEGTTLMRLAK